VLAASPAGTRSQSRGVISEEPAGLPAIGIVWSGNEPDARGEYCGDVRAVDPGQRPGILSGPLVFESNEPDRRLWYEPPGFVIPLVWFVLFTLLAIARYQLTRSGDGAGGPVVALAVLCATYAYYTLGLARLTGVSALWFGLFGNILVIIAALAVAYLARQESATAALLVVPVAIWTSFATAIVVGQMRLQGLA
jgi:tryptophan-rich sensory protein